MDKRKNYPSNNKVGKGMRLEGKLYLNRSCVIKIDNMEINQFMETLELLKRKHSK